MPTLSSVLVVGRTENIVVAKKILERQGAHIFSTDNELQAEEFLQERSFQFLFSDWDAPGIDPMRLIAIAKKYQRGLVFVVGDLYKLMAVRKNGAVPTPTPVKEGSLIKSLELVQLNPPP